LICNTVGPSDSNIPSASGTTVNSGGNFSKFIKYKESMINDYYKKGVDNIKKEINLSK
jgi:hypothetical protein